MIKQKIITALISPLDGEKAMQQIMTEAGDGSWKIINLIDLHRIQMAKQRWSGTYDPQHAGDLGMVVLEECARN